MREERQVGEKPRCDLGMSSALPCPEHKAVGGGKQRVVHKHAARRSCCTRASTTMGDEELAAKLVAKMSLEDRRILMCVEGTRCPIYARPLRQACRTDN